jgi:hypothetical protein
MMIVNRIFCVDVYTGQMDKFSEFVNKKMLYCFAEYFLIEMELSGGERERYVDPC